MQTQQSTEKERNEWRVFLALLLLTGFGIYMFYSLTNKTNITQTPYVHIHESVSWEETTIKVNYLDGTTETLTIEVRPNESYEKISLEDGTLFYWKATKETGGTVSRRTGASSYVKSYNVIKTEVKSLRCCESKTASKS